MSGNNDLVIENAIAQHAHDLFATHVILEYGKQIDKWQQYINRVVDAEREALKKHQDVLKAIINAKQEAEQASAMFAMLALSLLTGPALSWIGGAIQYKLYPALRSQPRLKHTYFYMENRKNRAKSVRMEYTAEEHNKVAAKIFGDAAANLTQQVGVEHFLANKIQVKAREKGNSFEKITMLSMTPKNASSDDLYNSLKTNLENALLDEKQKTIDTIADFALQIKVNPNFGPKFGKAVLEKLYREQPRTKQASQMERQQHAFKAVEKIVDAFRNKWAEDWFYYGNYPPNTSTYEMSRKIEREIWAMWMLDQDFRVVGYSRDLHDREGGSTYEWVEVKGRDKIQFASQIVVQLIELDVVIPQSTHQWVERIARQTKDPNLKLGDVRIDGNLDTKQEMTAIETWAKNHPPELLSGMFDREIRILPSIRDVHR